ncbi:valine--tRNA ligase [Candidatus Saccharibacteria bacterium]|nr:valine--tRNA ligase [Candidatus Saccharibacteria bacterium]
MKKANKVELAKAYEPAKYEADIYSLWEKSGAFKPSPNAKGEPFCIIMPPPNANGSLHAGHLMYVVEDIAARYARMQQRPTLWLPGTDHAGIETQFVYEQVLAKEGKTRHDLGQEAFYKAVWDFVEAHKGNIGKQMRSMGFSADWGKEKYTLDPDIVGIVYDTFEKLHKDGLIYRGNRIVNWDPTTKSAYADIEITHREQEDELYTLDYGPVQIATARPETIFADVAVAVHPADKRFKNLVGTEAVIPLVDRPIPIIADDYVTTDFGTGALKITPGHDKNDYEIGLRHNLPQISVIDLEGKTINMPEKYVGLDVDEARKLAVEDLKQAGKLIKTEKLVHQVAIQDRSKARIEPLITEQWFLRVTELNKAVVKAIESDQVKFYPARFKKLALDWLAQEHDWCISRQIWWGIRIPVYYKTSSDPSKDAYIIARSEEEAEKYYGKGNYRAETDTFDTWFSSGQWPFATLMSTGEFDQFYPTSLMATARDILHKWVTRMIMFGLYKTGEVPFRDVYLWGMVTDEKGQKLSKSKGNYDDPMKITAEYGTDALRLALSIGITPGNDGKISDEKVKGYRNYCNKVWNVARFALSSLPDSFDPSKIELKTPADHWIVQQINQAIKGSTQSLNSYKYSEAGQTVYSLLWDDLADKYLEHSKSDLNPAVLVYGLETVLRLLHPFAPFVTETIWQQLPWTNSNLITEQWPKVVHKPSTAIALKFDLEIIEILAGKQKEVDKTKTLKLKKEIEAKQNLVKITKSKLENSSFVENAPKDVVKGERARLVEAKKQLKELEAALEEANS